MSTQAALPKPEYGKLFGVTYDKDTKAAIVRAPRVLKVGIGIPRGRAVHVFMHNGDWIIRFGAWENTGGKQRLVMKTVYRGGQNGLSNKQSDVEAWYRAHKQDAAVSNRPQKIPHFTFTARNVVEDEGGRPVEVFEPDFDAIFAHGDSPKRIPVILTSDSPLRQSDEMWSATELKCHGDGLLAERVISMGSVKDQYWQQAKDAGLNMFPVQPCRLGGCPFSGKECKFMSVIEVQLALSLRLGATAYFTSTGEVTAKRLFSSLTSIRSVLDKMGYSLVGVPMYMTLSSFRANHEGKASSQPCVSLELTAAGSKALNLLLAENAWTPTKIAEVGRQISAAPEDMLVDAPSQVLAPAIMAEFSEVEFDDDEPAATQPIPAAVKTAEKTDAITERIRTAKATGAAVPTDPGAAQNEVQQAAPATQQPPEPKPSTAGVTWSDRASMNSAFNQQKDRIGKAAFEALASTHGTMFGSLKHDDPKAGRFYADLVGYVVGSAAAVEDVF